MNIRDEELQQKFERGELPIEDSADVKAYRQVFQALSKDPGYALPDRFAERVAARMVARNQVRDAKDYFWFGAGIFFLAIAFLATILFTGVRITAFPLDFGFLNAMADYKGLVLFGVLFVLLLHLVDKRVIRRQVQQ